MIKRVDVAIYNAFTDGTELESGAITLNLANEGVGYAMDEYNADLVSPDMVAAVDAAKANIISGDLAVHDYMSDNSCPVLNF
jgi:basic membrane protein A